MQEAGEEIDGLITTQSKLRQTIMDATKVASNNFKGVDILDDNGNYKTTYQILKGIAEVWDEIGEEDKKYGTNRQNFILETTAGKARASAAASILQNFDMLEEAYNDSLNSDNYANTSLEAYINSIDGKVQQLHNSLQELAFVSIDSTWIKDMISLGTSAISTITQISKGFSDITDKIPVLQGGFTQIITGLVSGGVLAGTGHGLNTWIPSFGKAISGVIDKFQEASVTSRSFGNDLLDSLYAKYGDNANVYNVLAAQGTSEATQQITALANAYQNANYTAVTFGQYMQQNGVITRSFAAGIKSVALPALKSFVSFAATMAATTLAVTALSAAFNFLNNQIHKSERIAEAGTKAKEAIKSVADEYKNAEKVVSEFDAEKFMEFQDKASAGTLSTDEYHEFADVCNQLSEIFPALTEGIDSNGNAIINLGNSAEEATAKLQEQLEVQQRLLASTADKNLPDLTKATFEKVEKDSENITKQNASLVALNAANEIKDKARNLEPIDITVPINGVSADAEDAMSQVFEDYKTALNRAGVSFADNPVFQEQNEETGKWEYHFVLEPEFDGIENVEDVQAQVSKEFETILADAKNPLENSIGTLIRKASNSAYESENDLKTAMTELGKTYSQALLEYDDYRALGERFQNLISKAMTTFDYSKLGTGDVEALKDSFGGLEKAKEMFAQPLIDALLNPDTGELDEAKVKLFDEITNMDGVGMTAAEFHKQLRAKAEELTGSTDHGIQNQILSYAGKEFIDESGKYRWNETPMRDAIINSLKQASMLTTEDVEGVISEDDIGGLLVEQIRAIYDGLTTGDENLKLDLSQINGMDDLLAWYEQYVEKVENLKTPEVEPGTNTLATLLNDEGYAKTAKTHKDNLDAIEEAITKYQELGKLTDSEKIDLMDTLGISDVSMENLSKVGLTELQKWVSDIKETASGLDLAPGQDAAIQDYINTLVDSYAHLGSSAEKAQSLMRSAFVSGIQEDDFSGLKNASDDYEEALAALKEAYGEDLNWEVIATMAIKDEFSGSAEEIIATYADEEFHWRVTLNQTELEKDIEKLTSDNEIEEAERGLKEAREGSLSLTGEDYADTVSNDYQIMVDRMAQLKDADTALSKAKSDLSHAAPEDKAQAQGAVDAAQQAVEQAEKDVLEAQTQYYKDQEAMNQADLNRYELKSQELQAMRDHVEQYAAGREAMGMLGKNKDYYESDSEILAMERRNTQQNLATLQALQADPKQYKVSREKEIEDLKTELQKIDDNIHANQLESKKLDLEPYKNELEKLKAEATTLQNDIDKTTIGEDKYAVSADSYNSLIENAVQQTKTLEGQMGVWQSIADYIKTFDSDYENNSFFQEAQTQIASIGESMNTLSKNSREWQKESILAGFSDDLKNADDLKTAIDSDARSIEDLTTKAEKAEGLTEITVDTSEQRGQIGALYDSEIEKYEMLRDLYKTIGTAMLGAFGVDSEEFKEYYDLTNEMQDKIDDLNASVTQNALKTNPVSAETRENIRKLTEEQAERERLREDTSKKFGLEDNIADRELAQNLREAYLDAAHETRRVLAEELQKAEEDQDLELIDSLKTTAKGYDDAAYEELKNVKKYDALIATDEITQAQEELDTLKDKATNFSNDISKATALGQVVDDKQYSNLDKTYQSEIKWLTKLRDLWADYRDTFEEHSPDWEAANDEYENAKNELNDVIESQISNKEAWDTKDITLYNAQLEQLQTTAEQYQDSIESTGRSMTSTDYSFLIENGDQQIAKMREIQEEYRNIIEENGYEKGSDKYTSAQSQISSLESSIQSITKSQREWNDAIDQLKIDNLSKSIERLNTDKAIESAERGLKEAMGQELTAEDYAKTLEDDQKIMDKAYDKWQVALEKREEKKASVKGGGRAGIAEYDKAKDSEREAYNEYVETQSTYFKDLDEQRQAELIQYDNDIADFESRRSRLQDSLTTKESLGEVPTTNDYANLIKNESDIIDTLLEKRQTLMDQAEEMRGQEGFTADNTKYRDIMRDIDSIDNLLTDSQVNIAEWQGKLVESANGKSIKEWTDGLDEVERAITDKNHEIEEATRQHLDTSGLNAELIALTEQKQEYAQSLADVYTAIADTIEGKETELGKRLMSVPGFAEALEGMGKEQAKTYREMASQMASTAFSAGEEIYTNNQNVKIPENIQHYIDVVKKAREELQSVAEENENQGIRKTADYYQQDKAFSEKLVSGYKDAIDKLNENRTAENTDATNAAIASIRQLIREEETAQYEDDLAEQLLPVEELERKASELDRITTDVSDKIEHLTDTGKVAGTDLYESQKSSFNNLKRVYQEIQKEYEKLAEKYKGTDIGDDYAEKAQAAGQKAREYADEVVQTAEAIDDLSKISTFGQLLSNTSDKGISSLTENFRSEMEALQEYQQALVNGEGINTSEAIAQFPKLSELFDVEGLEDALNDVKAEKLMDYISDFSEIVHSYPDAAKDAQSYLMKTLGSMDFSNIDYSDFADQIESNIYGGVYGPHTATQQQYRDEIFKYLEGGGDLATAMYMSVIAQWGEPTPEELVGSVGDLEATVKLNAEWQNLENSIADSKERVELNNAAIGAEQSGRDLLSALGADITSEDYEIEYNLNIANIVEAQEQLHNLQTELAYLQENVGNKDLNGKTISQDDVNAKQIEVYEAIQTLNSARTAAMDVAYQADQANIEQYQDDIEKQQAIITKNNALISAAEERGGHASLEQLQENIAARKEMIDLYDKQIEESKDLEEAYSKGGEKENADNLLEQMKRTQELEDERREQITERNREILESSDAGQMVNAAKDGLSEVSKSTDEIRANIQDLISEGAEVPDAYYGSLNEALEAEKEFYKNEETGYKQMADMAYQAGDLANYQTYSDLADQAAQSLQSLNEEQQANILTMGEASEATQRRIQALNDEKTLTESIRAYEEAQGQRKTRDDYIEDRTNAYLMQAQILDEIREKQNALNKEGADENTKAQLESDIKQLWAEYYQEGQNIVNATLGIELEDFDVTELESKLTDAENELTAFQTEMNNTVAAGGFVTEDMYSQEIDMLRDRKVLLESLAAAYKALADLHKDEEGNYDTIGQDYMKTSLDYASTAESISEQIEDDKDKVKDLVETGSEGDLITFEYALKFGDQDDSLSSLTDEFQEIINTINEYKTMISDGEAIDMSGLFDNIPELVGTSREDLSDALNDYSITALKQFGDDYWTTVGKQLRDSGEIDKARSYFENAISSVMDFSDMDTSEIRANLDEAISNLYLDENGEAYTGLARTTADTKRQIIDDYLAGGGSEEVALVVALLAEWTGMTPAEMVAAFDDMEIMVDMHINDNLEDEIRDKQRELESSEARQGVIEARQGVKEARGLTLDASDYEALIRGNDADIKTYEGILNDRIQEYWNLVNSDLYKQGDSARLEEARQMALNIAEAQSNLYETEANRLANIASSHEIQVDKISNAYDLLEAKHGKYMENQKTDLDNMGLYANAKYYTDEIRLAADEYQTLIDKRNQLQENAEFYRTSKDFGTDSSFYLGAIEQLGEVDELMIQLKADTQEWLMMLNGGMELETLGDSLTDLEEKATAVEDAITLREGKGMEPTVAQYESLVENGEQQIKNLQAQNRALRRQQTTLNSNSSTWRDIQSQIRSNNSAIAAMRNNINGWNMSMQASAETLGRNLLDALTNAFSESMSSTGLTTDTIQNLLAQFGDMSGFDMSGIFYNTAQGVKLDVDATKMLVEAQYDYMSQDIKSRIQSETEAYRQQMDVLRNGTDSEKKLAAVSANAHKTKIDQLYQQLAQYQALYAEQEKLFSRFSEFERAQSSANAGDTYNDIQGYLKTQQENYDKGLVGTDEFKAYTALFDEWGRESLAAYEENSQKMRRYITDDHTGIKNLFDDLVAEGYGTLKDNEYSFDIPDLSEAAHALGVSEEFLTYAFGRSEDYGFYNDFVESQIDGELKLQETAHDTAEAIKRRNDLIAEGAPQSVIDEANDEIQRLSDRATNLSGNIQDVVQRANTITSDEIQAGVDTITELKSLMDKATTEGEKNEYRKAIENVAKEYGNIPLDAELNVDKEALSEMYDGWDEKVEIPATIKADFTEDIDFDSLPEIDSSLIKNMDTWESGLQKVKDGWNDNAEACQQYQDALKGLTAEQLESINLNDGKYDSEDLIEAENALDSIAKEFGLSREEAENMVPILEQLGYLSTSIEQNAAKIYQRQTGINRTVGSEGVSIAAIESYTVGGEYEGIAGFDAAKMSVDELKAKIEELNNLKADIEANIETEGAEEALAEVNELIAATEQTHEMRIAIEAMESHGISVEQFLNMKKNEQLEIMAKLGLEVDDSSYEAFVATVESQAVRTKIETYLENGGTIEDLLQMKDEDLMVAIGCTTEELEEAKEMINQIDEEEKTIPVKFDTSQLSQVVDLVNQVITQLGLKPITLKVEAETDKAESAISRLQERTMVNRIPATTYTPQPTSEVTVQATPNFATLGLNNMIEPVSVNVSTRFDGSEAEQGLEQIASKETEAEVSAKVTETDDSLLSQLGNIVIDLMGRISNVDTSEVEGEQTTVEGVAKITEVDASGAGDVQLNGTASITSTTGSIDAPNDVSATVTVTANGQADVEALTAAIEEVHGKEENVTAIVSGTSDVIALREAIDSVYSKTVGVYALTSGLADVNALVSAIAQVQSKTVTVTVNTVNNTSSGTTKVQTGTMIAPSYASGSDDDLFISDNPLITRQNIGRGQVGLRHDESAALVNELGNESYIRDGKWRMFPSGMHVEHGLKKGDIILNHKQTEALMKNKVAPGHGRVVGGISSFAGGNFDKMAEDEIEEFLHELLSQLGDTIANDIGAGDIIPNASNGTPKGVNLTGKGASTNAGGSFGGGASAPATSSNSSGGGGGDSGSSDSSGSDSGSSSSDTNFSWEFFDHVQTALDNFARATERATNAITDYLTNTQRRNAILHEINKQEEELQANLTAENTYREHANSILKDGWKYADSDGNEAKVDITKYFKLDDLKKGNLKFIQGVDTTTEEAQAAVAGAQAYIEALNNSADAADKAYELVTAIRSEYNEILQLPLDKLDKSLEKISKRIEIINGLSTIMSHGESAVLRFQRYLNEQTGYQDAAAAALEARNETEEAAINLIRRQSEYNNASIRQTEAARTLQDKLGKKNSTKNDRKLIREAIANGTVIDVSQLEGVSFSVMELINNYNELAENSREAHNNLVAAEAAGHNSLQNQTFRQQDARDSRNSIPSNFRWLADFDPNKEPLYVAQSEARELELKNLRKELEKTLKTLDEANNNLKKATEDRDNIIKILSGMTAEERHALGFTDEDWRRMQNHQRIEDTTHLTTQGLEYYNTYDAWWTANEVYQEASNRAQSQTNEYFDTQAQAIRENYEDISNYYESLISYNEQLNGLYSSNLSFLKQASTLSKSAAKLQKSYEQQIENSTSSYYYYLENVKALRKQLREDLKSGKIVFGSQEWREAVNDINTAAQSAYDMRSEILSLVKEMYSIPNDKAEERIKSIQQRWLATTHLIDNALVSTKQYQRIAEKIEKEAVGTPNTGEKQPANSLVSMAQKYGSYAQQVMIDLASRVQSAFTTNGKDWNSLTTYENQNRILQKQIKELESEVDARKKAVLETAQNIQKAQTTYDKAKKAYDNEGGGKTSLTTLLSNTKKDESGGLHPHILYLLANGAYKEGKNVGVGKGVKFDALVKALQEAAKNREYINLEDYIARYAGQNFATTVNSSAYSALQDLIADYNAIIDEYTAAEGGLNAANEENQEAIDNFFDAESAYIKAKAELVKNELDNINTYFKSFSDHYATYAGTIESLRDLEEEIGDKNKFTNSDLMDNYKEQIEYLGKSRAEILKSIAEQQDIIRKTLIKTGSNDTLLATNGALSAATIMKAVQTNSEYGELYDDSEEFREAVDNLLSLENSARSTEKSIVSLYKKMREDADFKPINDAIDDLKDLRSGIESIISLINDSMRYTTDGSFTQLGIVTLTEYLRLYQLSAEELQKNLDLMNKIEEVYNSGNPDKVEITITDDETGTMHTETRVIDTLEDYEDSIAEVEKTMQESLKNQYSYRNAIISMITTRYKTEIDYLNDLIEKRKEALSKQKEMNEYDRSIKSQTNELQKLQMQIRALDAMDDAQSKAQRARLQAEYAEKQEELDQTIQDHVIDLRSEGLDDIKTQMSENYDKFVKNLEINVDSIIETINATAENIQGTLEDSNTNLANYLKTFNPNLTVESLGIDKFTTANTTDYYKNPEPQQNADKLEHYNDNLSADEYSFWKDTTSTLESTNKISADIYGNTDDIEQQTRDYNYSLAALGETVRNLSDHITTTEGTVLTPIEDSLALSNSYLYGILSSIDTSKLVEIPAPNSSSYNTPAAQGGGTATPSAQPTVIIESLINVEGNVDEDTLSRLQDIANGLANSPNFMNATYNYVVSEMAKEGRKRTY